MEAMQLQDCTSANSHRVRRRTLKAVTVARAWRKFVRWRPLQVEEHKLSPNERDFDGATTVHFAAGRGHPAVRSFFLLPCTASCLAIRWKAICSIFPVMTRRFWTGCCATARSWWLTTWAEVHCTTPPSTDAFT